MQRINLVSWFVGGVVAISSSIGLVNSHNPKTSVLWLLVLIIGVLMLLISIEEVDET